ncbi:glycosyltransferase [uncultured Microbacterium sp.]|uniref:glycosyltransferase n=1 Tax=uncultured Microbacterium sp. TaxID=191216 RepID=UPI00262A9087|nr:glycosyltransferase [uncultured Microbacterium sp.]
MRIGFLTPWRTDDPGAWSGIIRPMLDALGDVSDVVPVSTHDVPAALLDRAAARLSRRRYLWDFGLATARIRGRVSAQRLRAAGVDVVFAVAASVDVARLGGAVPVVQYVDASFDDMKDRYSVFTGLSRVSAMQVRRIGKLAARRTAGYVAASQRVADELAAGGVDLTRVIVAPPGAAIAPRPATRAAAAPARPLRVLVVASDWERKGGDRALAAVAHARAAGTEIALTVIGSTPALPGDVRALGRLGASELSAEYARADVLLELARANAAGVALTDAAAHGLPAIATSVGGVPSIVAEGRSGWLVPDGDAASAAAGELLVALGRGEWGGISRASAAAWYAEALDWASWAERVAALCGQVRDGVAR